MVRCQRFRHDPFNPSPDAPINRFPIARASPLIAVMHPTSQGFGAVLPADFQSTPG